MVILNKIYTKTGDDGTTGLGNGERLKKYDLRVCAYGHVDETNACIGIARQHTGQHKPVDEALERIQNDLFDVGADLATRDNGQTLAYEPLRVSGSQVSRLENEIDAFNKELETLRSFILPGGTLSASHLHLARTVCRRAERTVVELADQPDEIINSNVILYLNRLSDFLFVAARVLNDNGKKDVLWVPGENR